MLKTENAFLRFVEAVINTVANYDEFVGICLFVLQNLLHLRSFLVDLIIAHENIKNTTCSELIIINKGYDSVSAGR